MSDADDEALREYQRFDTIACWNCFHAWTEHADTVGCTAINDPDPDNEEAPIEFCACAVKGPYDKRPKHND